MLILRLQKSATHNNKQRVWIKDEKEGHYEKAP